MPQIQAEELLALEDEKLASLVKNGNEFAFEVITSRYLGLISSVASKYNLSNADFDIDDFIQEGLLGLFSACNNYDAEKNASFKNYTMICVDNKFKTIIKSSTKKRAVPRSSLLPMENELNYVSDNTEQSTQEIIESQEYIKTVYSTLKDKLSEKEYEIVKLYLCGMSYKEIADTLSISDKAVDNALQRVHKKLSS